MSLLVDCVAHEDMFLNLPFSLLLLCAVFCDFFRHRVDIHTTQISVDKQQGKHITPPRLQDLSKASTCSSLIRGVHFRACFADSWVAESAHSVSRRYYPLIGRSPGVPLLRVLLVSLPEL